MSHLVKLRRSAEKELDRLPEKTHDRIVAVLKALSSQPESRYPKQVRILSQIWTKSEIEVRL